MVADLVATAVVFGAFTHQIWDAFTHQGRWGTELVPALNARLSIAGHAIPGYKLFQYGSTLVGQPFLAVVALISLNRVTPRSVEPITISSLWKRRAALIVCGIPIAVGLYAIATQPSYYYALGMTIKLSGAIVAVLCLAYCGVFQAVASGDTIHDD